MIFITTGTQLPFKRMIKESLAALDKLNYSGEVLIQVQTLESDSEFDNRSNVVVRQMIDKSEYSNLFESARCVICHAGMGSIIKALELKQKIIIVPRLEKYGEHRNNHQVDTCDSFEGKFDNVLIANNAEEIHKAIVHFQQIDIEDKTDWKQKRQTMLDSFTLEVMDLLDN